MELGVEEKTTAKKKGDAKNMGKTFYFTKLTKKTLARRSRGRSKNLNQKGKAISFFLRKSKKNSEHNKAQNISCRFPLSLRQIPSRQLLTKRII
jgi:hypothetical protein